MKPSAPEHSRLSALLSYDILDSAPEAGFDRITALAADIFEAPIALISLVDARRQWFKSRQGLDVCSTSREQAFCEHALSLERGEILLVEAPENDPRFRDNPMVVGAPFIRFYAGAVLTDADGFNLGTLCVIDTKSRARPSPRDLARLQALAAMVVDQMEVQRRGKTIETQRQLIAQKEAQLRTLLETAPVGIVMAELPSGRIVEGNSFVETLLGHPVLKSADIDSYDEWVSFHADGTRVAGHEYPLARMVLSGEEAPEIEVHYQRGDGRRAWTRILGRPVRDKDGQLIGGVVALVDTDARRRAEIELLELNQSLERRVAERTAELTAERQQLQELIANAMDAVVVVDGSGKIESWNRQAEATFGWTAQEAVGCQLAGLLIPERFRNAHFAGFETFLRTGQGPIIGKRIEIPALRRNGEEVLIELAVSATQSTSGWRFTALMHDVTQRRAQTDLFENALHHAPIGLALVGLDGRFLKINTAFGRIVDYQPDELLSLTFQDITHSDDLNADITLLAKLTSGELPRYQMDKRYIRKDGRHVWVSLSVSMVRDAAGEPAHYIAQVQDLTERREAEARYQLMAENATDMIVTCDLERRTTFVSPAIRTILGWEPAASIGQQAQAYLEDRPALEEAFRRTLAGESGPRLRWRAPHRDGHLVWLESNPSLLRSPVTGEPVGYIDVLRDVTAQVEQDKALAKAREAADAAAQAKSEFLANMSHEIRTPLTAVIGFAGLLREQPLVDTARLYADRIATGGATLLSIVNDILDFSKLEAGEISLKPVATDVAAQAHTLLDLFQPQAETKNLLLEIVAEKEFPRRLLIDPQALRQILLNLVGNALKFTESGAVIVRLGHRQERLMVAVEDSGPGLSIEQQAALFKRFSQVDGSTTRRHGGTGLGLAICKGLVDALGGTIGVTSRPGRGSSFHFEVPAEAVRSAFEADSPETTLSLTGVRVLVADDSAMNRELARAMLESLGAECSFVGDGLEAVEAAGKMPFDVVLMDLRMPGLDGAAACRRIQGQPGPNRDIPILAFSAADGHEPLPKGFSGGIPKPVTLDALHRAIQHALVDQLALEDANASRG